MCPAALSISTPPQSPDVHCGACRHLAELFMCVVTIYLAIRAFKTFSRKTACPIVKESMNPYIVFRCAGMLSDFR